MSTSIMPEPVISAISALWTYLLKLGGLFWAKVAGALLGSLLGVIVHPGEDHVRRWLVRLFVGFWIGILSSHTVMDYFEWEDSIENVVLSTAIGGAFGYGLLYFVLKIIHNESFIATAQQFLIDYLNKKRK